MVLVSVVGSSRARRRLDHPLDGQGLPAPSGSASATPCRPAERDGDLAAAYARLLRDPDPAVHGPAAVAWCDWEDTHVATVPGHTHDTRYDDPRFRLCFARLVTHYWSNNHFVDDGAPLRDAHRLAGIPVVMINGQLDISGPLDVPWQLAKVLPDAELVVIDGEGHGGDDATMDAILAATDRFAV